MVKSFFKLDLTSGEDFPGGVVSETGLAKLLDDLFNEIDEMKAVEIHIYRKYVLIGTREKGHGDEFRMKFTNFGLNPNSEKAQTLGYIIRSIDGGSLPEYCYKAINGDAEALRRATEHVVRAYDAKIRRMQEKGKTALEIELVLLMREAVNRRLELSDEELLEVSEPIIVEIPKNFEAFYKDNVN